MATNAASDGTADTERFPTALPIELPYRSRLRWTLGTRVIDDEATDPLSRWEREDGWALASFRVADGTIVVRAETPIGRELFYAAELSARSTLRSRLESAPAWRRVG